MSIEALTWAFKQKLDDPTAKLVLLGIADKYNEDRGYAWPSVERLADMADCTERTVSRKLALLQEVGLIQILHNPPQTNRYFLPTLTECHPDTRCHGNPDTGDGVTLTPDVSQTIVNDSINNNNMINSSFDAFWEAVPKKVGKKAALRAYKTALKDIDADTLLERVKAYAQRVKDNGTAQQYILHPTTWLNQGRWDDAEDEVEVEQVRDNFGVSQRWMPKSKQEFLEKVTPTMKDYYARHRPEVIIEAKRNGWI